MTKIRWQIAREQVLEFWSYLGVKEQTLENQYPLTLSRLKKRVQKRLPIIVEELENLASTTIKEYLSAIDLLDGNLRSQVEDKAQLAGALFAVGDTAIIFLPKNQKPQSRKLFSFAHELGHYLIQVYKPYLDSGKQTFPLLLNRDPEGTPVRNADGTLTQSSFIEFKANQFAAEFLMPRDLILDLETRLQKRRRRLTRDYLVEQIVKNFNVSEPAAKIRIMDLELDVK